MRLYIAMMLTVLVACDGDSVRRQARAADGIARAFNGLVRPTLVQAYEANCRADIERVCPEPPCDRQPMVDALAQCELRWRPVLLSYESARIAHDVWRDTLLRCRATPDAGSCQVDIERDGASVVRAVTGYRCAVRSIGMARLDPLSGAVTCEASDGGR